MKHFFGIIHYQSINLLFFDYWIIVKDIGLRRGSILTLIIIFIQQIYKIKIPSRQISVKLVASLFVETFERDNKDEIFLYKTYRIIPCESIIFFVKTATIFLEYFCVRATVVMQCHHNKVSKIFNVYLFDPYLGKLKV